MASILIKRLRENGEKPPDVIPLEQLRKSYARFEVVNWRNTLIGHGVMGMDDSEEFRAEIKNKLRALNNIFEKLGEKLRQQDVYRKVYEKMSQVWGKKHLNTLAALNDIAFTLGKLGRFKEAIDRQQEVISIRTEVFGHDSYETLAGKVRLAELYRWAGDSSAEQKIVDSLLEQLTELGHLDLIERLKRK